MRFAGEIKMREDFVDPGIVIANAEIAGLELERLAYREERVEDNFWGTTPNKRRAFL